MQPKWHILWGFVFSYLLAYFFNISLIHFTILFLSTWFFIDLDHVLLYVIKTRNFNPLKFITWSREKKLVRMSMSEEELSKQKFPYYFFHGIEFLTILSLLSFWNELCFFILLGFIFHLILDFFCDFYDNEDFASRICLTYNYIKHKKLKKLRAA